MYRAPQIRYNICNICGYQQKFKTYVSTNRDHRIQFVQEKIDHQNSSFEKYTIKLKHELY